MKVARPDKFTLAAFDLSLVLGGANAVAVRFTVAELPPFWGAAIRFATASFFFWVFMLARRLPFPNRRGLFGVLLYGFLTFGACYAFIYWGIREIQAGLAQVILALVPLLTFFFAFAHGIEPFRWRGLLGAGLALAGIAFAFVERSSTDIPVVALFALIAGAACIADCATNHLGLSQVCVLDYIDGDVDQANPQEIIPRFAAHIRRIRPHVVVTFAPDGNYGHPDHIALSQFTAAALVSAADANFRDPDNLALFKVSKFYYIVDTKSFVEYVHQVVGDLSINIDGVERNHMGWEEWAVTTRIDTKAYFDTVWKAVLCHQSQLPAYGPLSELPRENLIRLFGEGTFIRVFSLVNRGRRIEHDLFEGLR